MISVVSFGVGLGVGYVLGRRPQIMKLETHPDPEQMAKVEMDLAEIRAKRAAQHKSVVIDEEAVNAGKEFVEGALEPSQEQPEPEVEMERRSVFANDDEWDYEEEKKTRDSSAPYVIHKDEFWSNEMEFGQHTLTYYNGDDIVADEEDKPVYNAHEVIGTKMPFGHGSGDPNVVYIRNEKRKEEFEVLLDQGLFSVEVLGLEIENNERARDDSIEHSARRFRPE